MENEPESIIDQVDEQLIGHLDTAMLIRMSKIDWIAAIQRRCDGMEAFVRKECALANDFLSQQKKH